MGGASYDRDVYSNSSSSSWSSTYDADSSTFGASAFSASKLSRKVIDDSMKPNGKILSSTSKNPIIIVLDVTGSNIEFARLVYDKMPMFWGQIEQQGYLTDFDIAFCAVGDAYTDDYPMQVADFAKGTEIDSWLEKVVLEGCGGGQKRESYELMAYYLYQNTQFAPGSQPIIFFIGDEMPYSTVDVSQAEAFGMECREGGIEPFSLLRKKVNDNVYMLLNKYNGEYFESIMYNCWVKLLAPEHVVKINEEKAIIDLILGIISMFSQTRTLETYKVDMLGRGQTQERIAGVSKSLENLSKAIIPIVVSGNVVKHSSSTQSKEKGRRL